MFAMEFLTASWLVIACTLFGLGLGVFRLMGYRDGSRPLLLAAIPMGYCASIAFLQIWHLWLPITTAAFFSLLVVAACALALSYRLTSPLRASPLWPKLVLAVVLLGITVWMSNRALGVGYNYDSGVYHWNAIVWANTYPIVKGLANLNDLLGLNNSSLLFDAMLNTGYWHDHAGNLGNGFMVLMLWLYVVFGFEGLVRGRITPENIFAAALVFPTISLCVDFVLAAPNTDPPISIMSLLGGMALSNTLLSDKDRPLYFITSFIFLATTVCLKLSGACLFAACLPIWLAFLFLGKPRFAWPTTARRTILAAVGLGGLLLGVWMVRGILLTGYPLFPSSVLPLPVDWRLPQQVVHWRQREIMIFARYYVHADATHSLAHWDWLPRFFLTLRWSTTWYCLESGLIALLTAWLLLPRNDKYLARRVLAFWGAIAFALACWFWMAPDIRFGWHLFWLVALPPLALLARVRWSRSLLVLWSIPIIFGAMANYSGWYGLAIQRPGPDWGFFPVNHPPAVRAVKATSGATLMSSTDSLPWNWPVAPYPLAGDLNLKVRYRAGHDVSRGFDYDKAPAGR